MNKIYVFFDGKCSVCKKEINFYKKSNLKDEFVWLDVNIETEKLKDFSISFNESLMFLHVVDKNGNTQIGVDAFLTIWNSIRYWDILASVVNFWPIKIVAKFFYNQWAKRRYNKLNYKCDI